MSERWVHDCERILDQIKKLEDLKGDRLEMVRTIRFAIYALQRSVSGWMEWINNPEVMARFSLEELKEIGRNLTKITQSFIEYDCKVTAHAQRDLARKEAETRRKSPRRSQEDIFYVK